MIVEAPSVLHEDLNVYCRSSLVIRPKEGGRVIPLELNFAQEIVDRECQDQWATEHRVRLVVLKARQEGVTTYVAARFFRKVQLWPETDAIVVTDKTERSARIFRIYRRFDAHLPTEMRPMRQYSSRARELRYGNPSHDPIEISLNPGLDSAIEVDTAGDEDVARGATYQLAHLSELSSYKKPEEAWISLMQAIPRDGTEVIVESTAKGRGNFFHRLWTGAVNGRNGFRPVFLPWWIYREYTIHKLSAHDRAELETLDEYEQLAMTQGFEWRGKRHQLTLGQILWRRRTIAEQFEGNERGFRQEFPATPDEAFLASGQMFFDEEPLRRYEISSFEPIFRGSLRQTDEFLTPQPDPRGHLRIWEMPQQGSHYVIFCDTAEGILSGLEGALTDQLAEVGGRDFSCADVFDVNRRKFVAQLHGHIAPEYFATLVWRLGYFYSCRPPEMPSRPALIGVERNHSSGQTIVRELRERLEYPLLYSHRVINRRTDKATMEIGWITSEQNRMPMLDDLAKAIRTEDVWLPNQRSIDEMFTFVKDEKGRPAAEEACHDDRVITAAGCLQMALRHACPSSKVGETKKVKRAKTPTGVVDYGWDDE